MGNQCSCQEFKISNFNLSLNDSECFKTVQWSSNRQVYLAYRFFMFAYTVSWLIAQLVIRDIDYKYLFFLTNIQVICINLYFTLGFIVAVFDCSSKHNSSNSWYHKLIWLLYTLSSNLSFTVVPTYWILLSKEFNNNDSFNIHVHAITLLLMLVDTFVISFPARLFHCVYVQCFGLLYIMYTFILHVSNLNSAVYPFLNWADNASIACAYGISLAVIGSFLVHLIFFGLYKLRSFIYIKYFIVLTDDVEMNSSNPSVTQAAKVNEAFDNYKDE